MKQFILLCSGVSDFILYMYVHTHRGQTIQFYLDTICTCITGQDTVIFDLIQAPTQPNVINCIFNNKMFSSHHTCIWLHLFT